MPLRIGYLIPEFPGQTHIFLWRERQALAELGIAADLVSTRVPPRGIASHDWSDTAAAETRYLLPLTRGDIAAAGALLRAGPAGWARSLGAVASASELGWRGRARMVAMVAMAAKLVAISREQGWSHIHVHSCADSATICMLAERLGGPSYSLTLHGPTLEDYGPNQRGKWRHARFGTVISQLLAGALDDHLGSDRPSLVLVAPMGVDLDRVQRRSMYRAAQLGEVFRIASVGRLNGIKAHDHLFDAVQGLVDRGVDARLDIAGEDEEGGSGYRRALQARIAAAGLSDRITLLGAVSEERVTELLENAHVFALASLNEGILVAIMEAMAMAMPVVVTDVGGNSELITSGHDAILVPAADREAMTAELYKVATDPAHAMRLAAASRARVEADFHHRRSAEAVAEGLRRTGAGAVDAMPATALEGVRD